MKPALYEITVALAAGAAAILWAVFVGTSQ